jgi:hypothetical protein
MSTPVSVREDTASFDQNELETRRLTLVDFTEDDYTRELGLGIVGHRWVPGKHALETSAIGRCQFWEFLHTHAAAIFGGHIFVRFFDQHFENRQWCMLIRQSCSQRQRQSTLNPEWLDINTQR